MTKKFIAVTLLKILLAGVGSLSAMEIRSKIYRGPRNYSLCGPSICGSSTGWLTRLKENNFGQLFRNALLQLKAIRDELGEPCISYYVLKSSPKFGSDVTIGDFESLAEFQELMYVALLIFAIDFTRKEKNLQLEDFEEIFTLSFLELGVLKEDVNEFLQIFLPQEIDISVLEFYGDFMDSRKTFFGSLRDSELYPTSFFSS